MSLSRSGVDQFSDRTDQLVVKAGKGSGRLGVGEMKMGSFSFFVDF